LEQQPDVATQMPALEHLFEFAAQTKSQEVPSQVAVAPGGGWHLSQEAPQ
jgi:hypothetical protein